MKQTNICRSGDIITNECNSENLVQILLTLPMPIAKAIISCYRFKIPGPSTLKFHFQFTAKNIKLGLQHFYRAMHFSAYARSWDRMSSVRPSVRLSVCDVGGL